MSVPLPDTTTADDLIARGVPPSYAEMVRAYEAELDLLWPKWRQRVPFGHLQYDMLARIKWLLKRRSLLMSTESGLPSPLNWDVIIVPDARNPRRCYAHPVMPNTVSREASREPPSPFFTGGQVDPRLLHSRPAANTPEDVAQKSGLPVELCREALACKPPRWMDTSVAWVERWVRERPTLPVDVVVPSEPIVYTHKVMDESATKNIVKRPRKPRSLSPKES